MATKNVYMRIKTPVQKIIRVFAGEIQIETDESVSDNDLIWYLIEQTDPDVAAQMKEISEKGEVDEDE